MQTVLEKTCCAFSCVLDTWSIGSDSFEIFFVVIFSIGIICRILERIFLVGWYDIYATKPMVRLASMGG